MIQLLPDFPEDVLAFEVRGRLTPEDYKQVLVPAVKARAGRGRPLNIFFHAGKDYDGIAPGAVWEDAKLGLSHWKDWGAIAAVSDAASIREGAAFLALFFHHPVRVFFNADYEEAREWITRERSKPA